MRRGGPPRCSTAVRVDPRAPKSTDTGWTARVLWIGVVTCTEGAKRVWPSLRSTSATTTASIAASIATMSLSTLTEMIVAIATLAYSDGRNSGEQAHLHVTGRRRHARGCELGRHGGAQRQRPAEAAHDARDVRASLARPLGREAPPGRRCRRASAAATSPPACSSRRCIRRACAAIAGRRARTGSRSRCGFQLPAHVAGMNCAMPCAPAGERADGVEAALGLELRREQRRRQLLGARRARDERAQRRGHVGRHAELAARQAR